MLKFGFAQINPTVGDFADNYKKIIDYIQKAEANHLDIIIFPELSILGFPPKDLLLNRDFIKENLEIFEKIKNKNFNSTVILGFADRQKNKLYNAAVVLKNKKILTIHRKIKLSRNLFFDENRYFCCGEKLNYFDFKGYKIFITVGDEIFDRQIICDLKEKKPDFILNLSAHPFYIEKFKNYINPLSNIAKFLNSTILVCNLVGGQDELVFDGGSFVISKDGAIIYKCNSFCEDFGIFEFDENLKFKKMPLDFSEVELVYKGLLTSISDYAKKNKFRSAVVGVSGGIDSAVVLCLATEALGNKNVFGLIMPSRFNSPASVEDAKKICENLKIDYKIINIDDIFSHYLKLLKPFFKKKQPDLTEENLQARIRAVILMAFSNKFGYLVLNTGNKSELLCGYCTLYGDLIGGFAVLKDIYKTFVYKLAYYINEIIKPAPIPERILKKEPSAELRYNQKDTDTLPKYSMLDPILKFYIEENLTLEEIAKKGYNINLVEKVIRMVNLSEYKRHQAPLGINVSFSSIFNTKSIPITKHFFK